MRAWDGKTALSLADPVRVSTLLPVLGHNQLTLSFFVDGIK